jgi:transposase
MHVIYERCCGLDVHKKSIVACLITPKGKEIRTFGTMTEDILALADWLKQSGCTHAAMESTGSFWKPIYNVLELTDIETLVVNAKHIKAVPGRKTDVKDAEWIADLLRHGLLQGSYIPNRDQRELRELTRYRRSLIEERSREVNRMQKVLEGANIKLSSVASDITGVSGRAMIKALVDGVNDPKLIAQLAKRSMKKKIDELERALNGLIGPHQRMMLATQLRHIEFLEDEIEKLDQEIKKRMHPFSEDLELLETIPGIGERNAQQILAEIGTDMDRFPTAHHLASWAGMAPGNHESAGKRKSGKTIQGNKKLRSCLIEAAQAAARSKKTYFHSQYHRIGARRGKKRAAVAVGHSILIMIYYMLKRKEPYKELGPEYFEKRREISNVNRAVKKLEKLGYRVTIEKHIA